MDNLKFFKSFAPKKSALLEEGVNAVIYTRVSDSSQEFNTSLESQLKSCESFALRKGLNVLEYFGGTYESAKTDDRKEFNRMLSFVKRSKNISYILVYSYERFSRSGVGGAQIADDLLKQYGVITLAVSQELDPRTVSGSFQQKIFFLFGQMDNEMRKDKTLTGMRELLRKGYCPYSIPRGYVNLNKGKAVDQKIVLNEEGKILQKAFLWKADQQMRNFEIIKKLAQLGVKIDERRLGEMFANPFYCGIIVSRMIPDEVIEGKHQPMISKDIFLRVNNVVTEMRTHPVSHNEEDNNLPLKLFMKCSECNTPMTGYIVRKKNLYYYKCRTKGCKVNKSAKQIHEKFKSLLEIYRIKENESEGIKESIIEMFKIAFEEEFENQKVMKAEISILKKKLENVRENRATGEIDKEMFIEYSTKYNTAIHEIEKKISKFSEASSNLQKCLDITLHYCQNPLKLWEDASIGQRTIFQNLIYPSGISYNHKNDSFRTPDADTMFIPVAYKLEDLRGKKKGGASKFASSPFRVRTRGFEPPRLLAPPPQDGMSTSFTTCA